MAEAARVIPLHPVETPPAQKLKSNLPEPDMGGIEPRYDGTVFRARWQVNGRREHKSFDTYQEALDFLNEMAISIRKGGAAKVVSKARTPFADFAKEWLAEETTDLAKKETFIRLHFNPAFGKRPIGDITRKDVQRWINKVQRDPATDCEVCEQLQAELGDDDARCRTHKGKKPPSARSIRDHYVMLSQIMRAAERDGYLPNGCPVGKRLHKLPKAGKRMVILNARQEDHLLEVAAEQFPGDFVMVHLDDHTGLRLGELVALGRGQYDGESLLVDRARKADGKVGTTKTDRERRVALFACCRELLDAHLATHDHDLIFPTATGKMQVPTNWRKRVWYPLVEAAGLDDLDLHFHDLRHTHCSNLLAAGWEVTVVSERLGHASTKMTLDVYAHALPGRQQKLLAAKGLRPEKGKKGKGKKRKKA